MNAERLHSIALHLRDELGTTEQVTLVREMADYLRQQAQDPAQPDHQVQVSTRRERLAERLAAAGSNTFSDAWRLSLDDLGVADLLGESLKARIDQIFVQNEITPTIAADQIGHIAERLEALWMALENLITSSVFFGIGTEELPPGEFEIGFLIPRDAVHSELSELGAEFVELRDVILGPILELATGTRPEVKVRALSSSSFQVYLAAIPGFAIVMAKIIESLLTSYEKFLHIRETHASMKERGVPDETLDPLLEYAKTGMADDIEALTERLLEDYGDHLRGEGRANEIRVDVRRSLTATANRIDDGYSIDVRTYHRPESTEDEGLPDGVTPDSENARREIQEKQPRMRTMNLTGSPILELPEGDGNEHTDGDETEAAPEGAA